MQDINLFNYREFVLMDKKGTDGELKKPPREERAGGLLVRSCQSYKKLPTYKCKYGITADKLMMAKLKHEDQKKFLEENFYQSEYGEIKSYLELSMSANFSKKYFAEVANRVSTINDLNIFNDLTPVFLTVTLNGCFRDSLFGNYDRFKDQDFRSIFDQDSLELLQHKIINKEPLTIHDLSFYLNTCWRIYNRKLTSKFKGIKKEYVKCLEPHKRDGVPHMHILMYLPSNSIDFAMKKFKEVFYAPQNLRSDSLTLKQRENGEMNGFQVTLDNPTGYILKYINKSFLNVVEDEKMSEIHAWYIVNKIRRLTTSQSTVPLWVFRKINFFKKNFYNLNYDKRFFSDTCYFTWSYKDQTIFYKNYDTKEEICFEDGVLKHYKSGILIHNYEKVLIKNKDPISNPLKHKEKMKIVRFNKKERKKVIPIRDEKNNLLGYYFEGNFTKNYPLKLGIHTMSDYALYNHFFDIDLNTCNMQHYILCQNELILRGLIPGELKNVNDYSLDF